MPTKHKPAAKRKTLAHMKRKHAAQGHQVLYLHVPDDLGTAVRQAAARDRRTISVWCELALRAALQ